MAKSKFAKQFKQGTFPDEHWDESVRTNGHEPASPSKMRKRKSLSKGTQIEANPGMVGKADYPRKRSK